MENGVKVGGDREVVKATRQDRLDKVKDMADTIKQPIPVLKFIRQKIVQEEIVEAYQSPLPSGVTLPNGQNKMVEKGNWVVIHGDGSLDSYTKEEFMGIFEPLVTASEPVQPEAPGADKATIDEGGNDV